MSTNDNRPSVMYQRDQINVKAIVVTAAVLLGVVALSMTGIYLTLRAVSEDVIAVDPNVEWRRGATSPGVQPNQSLEYKRMLRDQQQLLSSYAWDDDNRNFAHIPIERAMRLMVTQSLEDLADTYEDDDE